MIENMGNMGYIGYIGLILLCWNVIVFMMYGIDKSRAKSGNRRISEKSLILISFLMGGAGAFAGMYAFHHKTKHRKFGILIPVALICNGAIVILAISGL